MAACRPTTAVSASARPWSRQLHPPDLQVPPQIRQRPDDQGGHGRDDQAQEQLPQHDASLLSAAPASNAASVLSHVGSALALLNRRSSAIVSRPTRNHALSGKCSATVSRHTGTGSGNALSLLHGTWCTDIFPSATPNTVPLNSSSNGITPSSSALKYLVDAISRS